jgi:hypothetical protein
MTQRVSFTLPVLLSGLLVILGCNRSPSSSSPEQQTGSVGHQDTIPVPPDLKVTVNELVHAVETLDIPKILATYADDFKSGTGRPKESLREVLTQLQKNQVKVQVEKTDFEQASDGEAKLRTQIRLRYTDTFRELGEGEVLVTDVLRHSFRKENEHWYIYKDQRVATYREGRFGERSPNVQVEVPVQIPTTPDYTVSIAVQRESDKTYQVMVGNYLEDPGFLPPPDIVTALPEQGPLTVTLTRNPHGRGEMVRITVITEDGNENWVGATTVSKYVPGLSTEEEDGETPLDT